MKKSKFLKVTVISLFTVSAVATLVGVFLLHLETKIWNFLHILYKYIYTNEIFLV